MTLNVRPGFSGVVGPIVAAVDLDGKACQAVLPAMTLVDATGAAAGSTSAPLNTIGNGTKYETVAASQTAQVMGTTGAIGDLLSGLLIIPATTTPGLVTILDNATSIPVFVGGTTTVQPFFVPLGIKSVSGAWKVTTGANVSVIACGNFT